MLLYIKSTNKSSFIAQKEFQIRKYYNKSKRSLLLTF